MNPAQALLASLDGALASGISLTIKKITASGGGPKLDRDKDPISLLHSCKHLRSITLASIVGQ